MSSNDVETGGTPLLGPAATEKQEHWSRAWSRKAYASLSNCSLGLVFGLLTACALQVRFLSATCMCNMCCNGCVSVQALLGSPLLAADLETVLLQLCLLSILSTQPFSQAAGKLVAVVFILLFVGINVSGSCAHLP